MTLYNIPSSGDAANPASLDGFVLYKVGSTSITNTTTVTKAYSHSLVAHWTVNTNTAYTVEHYQQTLAGGSNYTKVATDIHNVHIGIHVKLNNLVP